MKVINKSFFERIVLDNIFLEEYGFNSKDDKEKVNEVYRIFKEEYVHKNNAHISEVTIFKEWLTGLPSVFTLPYYNYDILELARDNKQLTADSSEADKDDFLNSYWDNCSKAFFELKKKL